jgi:hypothetical protein
MDERAWDSLSLYFVLIRYGCVVFLPDDCSEEKQAF